MAKVHVCLKRSYVVLMSVMAIISLLLLGFTVLQQGTLRPNTKVKDVGMVVVSILYMLSAIVLLFAIIGGFGIWAEKKWALTVFAVGMILCSLILLTLIIIPLTLHQEIERELKKVYLRFLPLANSTESELEFIHQTQKTFHCCGLESINEWENRTPESCVCVEKSTNKCINGSVEFQTTTVYSEPCLPILIQLGRDSITALIGILLGLVILLVLSDVLCVAILCQMNKKLEMSRVVYSSEAEAGNYDDLTETPETDKT